MLTQQSTLSVDPHRRKQRAQQSTAKETSLHRCGGAHQLLVVGLFGWQFETDRNFGPSPV
jgi:hypothetical protein